MAEVGLVRTFARELFKEPLLKLLSLGIALFAWFYVQDDQLVESRIHAEVRWTLPEGLRPIEPVPTNVSAVVTGTRAAVRRAQRMDLHIDVDLSKLSVGAHDIDLASFGLDEVPAGVTLQGFAPPVVRVALDELSMRKVKVEPVIVGDPAPGHSVSTMVVDPAVVTIRAPRAVAQATSTLQTKPIDVSGLTADVDTPVDLELPWGIEVAGGQHVRAHVEVEPVLERRTFDNVSVVLLRHADQFTIAPATVSVQIEGPAAALDAIGADDVFAVVYLPDNPSKPRYDAHFGQQHGVRLEVIPTSDQIRAVSVKPPLVEVIRR